MTIDEAIRYCEKQADLFAQDAKMNEQRKKQNINPKVSDELLKKSLEGVDRNRQIAEWLKELKRLKSEQEGEQYGR